MPILNHASLARTLTQRLRAQHDALNAAAACLGDLVAATRPLRRAVAAWGRAGTAAGGGPGCAGAEAGAAGGGGGSRSGAAAAAAAAGAGEDEDDFEERSGLRELCAQLELSVAGAGGGGGGDAYMSKGGGGAGGGSADDSDGCSESGAEWRKRSRSKDSSGGGGGGGGARNSPARAGQPQPPRPHLPRSGSGSASGGARPAPPWACHLGCGDAAATSAAAARFAATDAVAAARRVREYVHACSVDVLRLRAGAPDAREARARLASELDKLMAFSAGLLAANPKVLGEASTLRLDTLERYAPAAAPGRAHWVFALRQAALQRGQRLAARRLLDAYRPRISALMHARDALLARQAAVAGDGDLSAAVLDDLERLQAAYAFLALAFPNAMYSRVMAPDQAAALWAAAYPFVPQLAVIDEALRELEADEGDGDGGGGGDPGDGAGVVVGGGGAAAAAGGAGRGAGPAAAAEASAAGPPR